MADDDSHVPDSPAGYRPRIHGDHKDVSIDVKDPRWADAINRAHAAKLTHGQFAHQLAAERDRVLAAHQAKARPAETPAAKPAPAAPAAAAPARAAPEVPYKDLSMSAKL